MTLNNLPGSQVRRNVEVFLNKDQRRDEDPVKEGWKSEDEIPVSFFV